MIEWKKMVMIKGNAPRGQQSNSPTTTHWITKTPRRGNKLLGCEWQRFIHPERAKAVVGDLLLPLQGVVGVCYYTQGGALGYEVIGLSGRNKGTEE